MGLSSQHDQQFYEILRAIFKLRNFGHTERKNKPQKQTKAYKSYNSVQSNGRSHSFYANLKATRETRKSTNTSNNPWFQRAKSLFLVRSWQTIKSRGL